METLDGQLARHMDIRSNSTSQLCRLATSVAWAHSHHTSLDDTFLNIYVIVHDLIL